jgi:hypothetical protein
MKRLLLLAVLIPSPSFGAEDLTVSVRINYSNFRITPNPGLKTPHTDYKFVISPDGAVQEFATFPGPFGRTSKSVRKVGDRFNFDGKTIERKFENRAYTQTLTVSVAGNKCQASMKMEMKPGFTEFEGVSTELGVPASFRDWKFISAGCAVVRSVPRTNLVPPQGTAPAR